MFYRVHCPASGRLIAALMLTAAIPLQAAGQTTGSTLGFGGVSGLIDMPTAGMLPDGEIAVAVSRFGKTTRATLTFQIAPRLQGSFRYTGVDGLAPTGSGYGPDATYYDRSFDVRFQALTEGPWWPAITVGLADIGGTGHYSGEYIVATKSLPHRVRVTAGVGWGRFGSHGSFGSTGHRPSGYVATGGSLNADRWFRGDVAAFGGIEWQATDRLGLKVEYSSDGYLEETANRGLFERKSSVNFGAEYQVSSNVRLGAYYMYGSEFGLAAHFTFNPRRSASQGLNDKAPMPVAVRPARAANPGAWTESWAEQGGVAAADRFNEAVSGQLANEGILLESLRLDARSAEVRVRNIRNDAGAQAMGRIARSLAATLPMSVETFHILPVVNGVPVSRITIRRSDLERLEFAPDNAAALRQRVQITDAAGAERANAVRGLNAEPRFTWGLSPYMRYSLFDPDKPFRADVGLRASAQMQLAPGFMLSGSVTGRLAGNMKGYDRQVDTHGLPAVRTSDYLRDRRGYDLERLTLAWFARPGSDLYSRVSMGYLERGYGGVSTELLWKPVDSRLAIGAELNYVKQRAFHSITGFEDYSVATGHLSAYYAFDNGYHAQLDVGRYLAGDIGATLSLDREFENGWKVGAFATKTDISASQFGEGSFDKGVRLTIPLSSVTGTSRRNKVSTTIRPIQRDGGARLHVQDRLYDSVREYHAPRLDDQWGRVWR